MISYMIYWNTCYDIIYEGLIYMLWYHTTTTYDIIYYIIACYNEIIYDGNIISHMNSQYMGRIGIPRLMKVASIYSTMEIGTLPGPTRDWAIWKDTDPLAWPPRMRSALAFFTLWTCRTGSPWAVRPPATPQYHLHLVFKESDILLTIAFLTHVKDVLDRPHQPLMHVVINLISVEFRMFQHVLNEILQIPGVHSLQSLEIQKNALALCERATVVRLRGRQVSSLWIQNYIPYRIPSWCSMQFSAI